MKRTLGVVATILGLCILGGSGWLLVSGAVGSDLPWRSQPLTTASPSVSASVSASAPALGPCVSIDSLPRVPVLPVWEDVIRAYYAVKGMRVKAICAQAVLLDVTAQRVGEHRCRTVDGGESAWTGSVPETATAAAMVWVTHDPYPVTQTPGDFLTLADSPQGWAVVSESTGP